MAKKVEKSPVRLPDFQTQILQGTLAVVLEETDNKVKLSISDISTIHTINDVEQLLDMLTTVVDNYYTAHKNDCCCEEVNNEVDNLRPCYCH